MSFFTNTASRRSRLAPAAMLAALSLTLSGCVAALLPIAAGGLIAKTQIDARKRAQRAESTMENPQAEPENNEQTSGEPIVLPPPADQQAQQSPSDQPASMRATERLLFSNVRHPYLAFTLYALEQAENRAIGKPVRSAVLVENISLANPKAIECGAKRAAVIIDMDEAGDAGQAIAMTPGELAILLETLREADIRIAWISGDTEAQAQGKVTALKAGETPALKDNDLVFHRRKGGFRKQEQRWELSKDYCVLAIAGDRRADFDELFDYLRKPDLAIRLDAFNGRGWFELPPPTRALGAGGGAE